MKRRIVYPGQIPLDTDILQIQQNNMLALSDVMAIACGTATVVSGLFPQATVPPSMQVSVSPGRMSTLQVVDTTPFGTLPADTGDTLIKLASNLVATSFVVTSPTVGYTTVYLLECAFSEPDTTPIVLPYYNAANPGQPYQGPNNSAAAQNTTRDQIVQLQIKVGTPAPTGAQTTPATDTGWFPLAVISVPGGVTSVTQSMMAVHPLAPYVPFTLQSLAPGFSNMRQYYSSQPFYPASVGLGVGRRMKCRLWGAGGAGGSGNGGAGGGGAAAGYIEFIYTLTANDILNGFTINIGAAGTGNAAANGSAGANSSVVCDTCTYTAYGGGGGTAGGTNSAGGGSTSAGTASAGTVLNLFSLTGGAGGNGMLLSGGGLIGGNGGSAHGGNGGFGHGGLNTAIGTAQYAPQPGCGGAGGVGNELAGNGAGGICIVEW